MADLLEQKEKSFIRTVKQIDAIFELQTQLAAAMTAGNLQLAAARQLGPIFIPAHLPAPVITIPCSCLEVQSRESHAAVAPAGKNMEILTTFSPLPSTPLRNAQTSYQRALQLVFEILQSSVDMKHEASTLYGPAQAAKTASS